MSIKRMTTMLVAVFAAILLAACGDDESTASEDPEVSLSGDFGVVPDAPEGSAGVTGTATETRSADGTRVQIELGGLEPDTAYMSHVHAGTCDQPDPGGPHYKFDLDGADEPPNEIHMSFTSNADGAGSAEAENDQRIPEGEGMTVVVHLAESGSGEEHGMEGSGEEHMDSKDEMAEGKEHEHSGHSHSDMPKVACAELS